VAKKTKTRRSSKRRRNKAGKKASRSTRRKKTRGRKKTKRPTKRRTRRTKGPKRIRRSKRRFRTAQEAWRDVGDKTGLTPEDVSEITQTKESWVFVVQNRRSNRRSGRGVDVHTYPGRGGPGKSQQRMKNALTAIPRHLR
jgi:hypothetical protein